MVQARHEGLKQSSKNGNESHSCDNSQSLKQWAMSVGGSSSSLALKQSIVEEFVVRLHGHHVRVRSMPLNLGECFLKGVLAYSCKSWRLLQYTSWLVVNATFPLDTSCPPAPSGLILR